MSTPLDGVDAVFADLDGVVYTGRNAIPHAVDSLNRVAERMRVGYITNNASRTTEQVAEHLSSFGLSVTADDVVSSPQAGVRVLAELVPAGSRILVVGGIGLTSEVEAAGFVLAEGADDAEGVIQGFHPTVSWTHLAEAAFAVQKGIPWVATNQDWTIPQERGIAPGNGTLVSAVHTAAGVLATVAGKPEKPIFDVALERFGTSRALMVGDRLDTDIQGAFVARIPSAHVLTGIDHARQLLAASENQQPTYILGDLRELHEEYPETVVDGELYATRDSVLRWRGDTIEIVRHGHPLDLLRTACGLVWNSGRQIYGFYLPEELYELG